jgi:hypothetical protein
MGISTNNVAYLFICNANTDGDLYLADIQRSMAEQKERGSLGSDPFRSLPSF